MQRHSDEQAFTLIELMTVIAVVAILFGIAFPAYISVMERARKTQAKNDLTQIVTAVNAYYTEYGKYPIADADQGTDKTFSTSNKQVLDILRSIPGNDPSATDPTTNKYNLRKIVFISPPDVKAPNNPRSGIASQAVTVNGISVVIGDFVDPWGTPYKVLIDGAYDNSVANPYGAQNVGGAGTDPIQSGVIAWSFGKDQTIGTKTPASASFTNSDDVISWQ